ncbi:MAG: thioredoxin family protein [Pontiella sp.]
MKKHPFIGILVALTAINASALQIGDSLVDTTIKMQATDGPPQSLSELTGEKGTLIIFTCNKCPFVDAWQSTMVELGNTYSKKGIGVAFINSNDPSVKGDTLENMKSKAQQEGYQFAYLQDTTSGVARSFGAKKTPDVFLFNAQGKLVYQGAVGEGGRSVGTEIWLKDALEALLAGHKIENSQTKAIGCGIQFR